MGGGGGRRCGGRVGRADRRVCVRARASVCCTGILKGQEQNLLSATSLLSPPWEGRGFCGLFFCPCFCLLFANSGLRTASHSPPGSPPASDGRCSPTGELLVLRSFEGHVKPAKKARVGHVPPICTWIAVFKGGNSSIKPCTIFAVVATLGPLLHIHTRD